MASLNNVIVIGNLTRDPELKYLPDGTAVCNFSIAVNERWVSNGEKRERVDYFDVEAWRKTAESIGQYMFKGSQIAIQGKLKQERWENKEGQKRSRVKIQVFRIVFLDKKGSRGEGQSSPQGARQEETGGSPMFDMPEEDVPF